MIILFPHISWYLTNLNETKYKKEIILYLKYLMSTFFSVDKPACWVQLNVQLTEGDFRRSFSSNTSEST